MSIYKKTSTLAVRHVFHPESWGAVAEAFAKDSARVFGHVAEEATGRIVGDWAKAVAEKVRSHFTDHSERLSKALAESNERAWKALEIGLGGQRFWDRFASAEDQALRDQVRDFLTSALKEDDPGYLAACLKELRQARENGLLAPGEGFILASVADEISPFARFDDPEALLAAECTIVEQIAREFQRLGYRHLGRLLSVSPTRGQPLLAMAAQYYFRRAVGEDAVLSREITWVKLNTIDRNVQDGFAFLAMIQERHGRTVEEALDGLARLEFVVGETRDAVLSLHDDVRGLIDQFKLSRRDLTPAHAVSYRDEDEKQLIEAVKRRYRALSDDQRRRFPQIGLDLSRLDVVAGDFKSALAEAREAAEIVNDATAKAEAHHAAYRAALELRLPDEALVELRKAAAADARFTIWPAARYQVEKILGAGAFGVALLCRDTYLDHLVVVKSFEPAGIDRDVAAVFREARILRGLRHPGIIDLESCGFVDEGRKQRPYLVIEHFAGSLTLEDHVNRHGPLALDDLLPIAEQTALALKAAHDAGVWHRDVKPANLLVRKTARGWEVKVIDFGLSLRRSLVRASQAKSAAGGPSMVGSAVAGTLNYASPEQLDPARAGVVGPHSDVFGFGRTCYFALFREPYPDQEDIDALPKLWKDFIGRCTAKKIDRRPKDFAAVVAGLGAVQTTGRELIEPDILEPKPEPAIETTTKTPPSPAGGAVAERRPTPPEIKTTKKTAPSPQFKNSAGMTMVRVEPGEFLMGSTRAQIDTLVKQFPGLKPEYFDAEQPQHPVKITRPFYLCAHQLTVGQFRRFVDSAGYKTEAEASGTGAYGLVGKKWKRDPKINWRNPGFPQADDHPVVCVSHTDALAFLGWLNDQEKNSSRGYRLPTEAEWEYACRAGRRGLYGESDDPESLVRIANVADASLKKIMPDVTCIASNDGHTYTSPVGSFAHNGWHLYDMIGNVWEWCDDWYDASFYKSAPKEDPRNVNEASNRVVRGGAWSDDPGYCRPAYRYGSRPDLRNLNLGFRVAAVQD